jgi:hypothetical protein
MTKNGERNGKGQFKLGHTGAGGRPKGARNKLAAEFLDDLYARWQESGKEVLAAVCKNRPHDFLKVVAALMPREIDIDQALTVNLSVLAQQDFGQAFAFALKHIGSEIEIEHQDLIELNGHASDE